MSETVQYRAWLTGTLRRLEYGRDLLLELIGRDLKIRYKRSYLGILWSLLTPLAQVLIFSFLFRMVLPLGIPHYTAFVFTGLLAWSWFSAALSSASWAVVANPELIRRPGFPAAVLPILTVASNGVHFMLALPILLVVTVIDGGTFGVAVAALPLVLLVQFLLTLGIAYIVATSNVRFRDTQHLMTLLLMATFYLTPIFYTTEAVPDEYRYIHAANPLASLLTAYRDILIDNEWPDASALLTVSLIAAICLAVGYAMFHQVSMRFAEDL